MEARSAVTRPEECMNRTITQKFLLVIVLVTLMGAGAMSSASNMAGNSAQNQAAKNTAYIMGSADNDTGLKRANPHADCLAEKQSKATISSRGTITARNRHRI